MSKIKLLICLFVFLMNNLNAYGIVAPQQKDLAVPEQSAVFRTKENQLTNPKEIYDNIKPVNLNLENNLDPYEQQDNHDVYRSPYPLIRTTKEIFSQATKIPPGYYLLTPRKIGAKTYLFFKQAGRVNYIAPVFQIEQIEIDDYYPQPEDPYAKFPWGIRHVWKFLNIMVGRYTPPIKVPEHKVEFYNYDSDYYGIDVYFKDKMYKTIYKLEPYEQYL